MSDAERIVQLEAQVRTMKQNMHHQKAHVLQLTQQLTAAHAALSWDQRKVLELKRRFAGHAIMYRQWHQRTQQQLSIAENLLFELANMPTRYTHFFAQVSYGVQTVAQCMQVIQHIHGSAAMAVNEMKKHRGW